MTRASRIDDHPLARPTLQITAHFDGQQAAIRAIEAWNEQHKRVELISQSVGNDLQPEREEIACFYFDWEITIGEMNELREMLAPHALDDPAVKVQILPGPGRSRGKA